MKKSYVSTGLGLVVAASVLTVSSTSAFAGPRFAKNHPRRQEVLKRDNNEMKKNEAAEDSGEITKKQEHKLNRQDRAVKREEQDQAKEHGGHITKAEQRKDNRQENRMNRERNNMEKRDASKAAAPPVEAPVSAPATAPATTN
jgi:Skp family chaperone for outer membrane proteins